MQQHAQASVSEEDQAQSSGLDGPAYDGWVNATGAPVVKGYYVPDLRELDLGLWAERECRAAFLQLSGQEGISESRVTEIAPGKALPPVLFALDEAVYVVDGRGLATVWVTEDSPPRTFEWQKHSLFMLPRGCRHQLSNASGTERALLLHYNYLPAAMDMNPDIEFFFGNDYRLRRPTAGDLYAEARASTATSRRGVRNVWSGNFFPDMRAWDKLEAQRTRGATARSVSMEFPDSPIWSHLATFPSRTYKKAHRHGPGVVIVIPAGEGYSVMWADGGEKVLIPWHESSVFVPPNRWFHQHFNPSGEPVRYLAFHAPRHTRLRQRPEDMGQDQIEYPDEDPWIRQTFEAELGRRGLSSLVPEKAYEDRDFEWEGDEDDAD